MSQKPQRFADARILQFFPTCVWLHDLKPADYETINDQVIPKIEELLTPRAETIGGGIWQTNHDLHYLPEFAQLVSFMNDATAGVLDNLQIDHRGFQITGCWANVNPSGTAHRPHTHPNNFLSGVYYAQVPDEADGLVFRDPRPQNNVLAPSVKKVTPQTMSHARMDIRLGRIVLFPSWFEHSVQQTSRAGERISISFNVMLSAYAEELSPPRWSRRSSL